MVSHVFKLDIFSQLANMNVLVTGGTGLIGREVVRILVQAKANVSVVSLDAMEPIQGAEYCLGDLTDLAFAMEVTKNKDFVFHLAGIKGSIEVTKSRPASFFVPLLMFNTNVLEASRKNGVKKLVYTSSIGAYPAAEIFEETMGESGDPMDMYPGWAKRMAELQIRAYSEEYGLDWSIVRPCNVYGPGDNFDPNNAMVIPSLMMRISNGESPLKVWGDGSAVRDFAFSRDVAMGTIQALVHGTRGSFINLGSGVGYSIKELVETLNQVVQFEYEFDATKSGGFPRRVMKIDRAREWVGYEPQTTLLEGLRETWEWFQQNKDEYLLKKNYFRAPEA
jgi:GDP-L-fucose synthase